MKKLLYKLLFIAVIWFVFDRAGGWCMWWVNQHTHDVTSPKLKQIVEGIDEEVVIMGTSRCNSHYVPSIISDTIRMQVYNAGIDGSSNIFPQYMALCHILAKKRQPACICLEVENNFISEEEDAFKTTSFFAPYFGINHKADAVFFDAGTYWLYQLSHLYRFNAKALPNITGLFVNKWGNEDHGYIPSPAPPQYPNLLEKSTDLVKVDEKKKEYIKLFIGLCRSNGIRLVFMVSPSYSIADSTHYDVLKQMANQNGIPFLDYHSTGMYLNHPDFFRNEYHLWDKGARLYSSVFASDLKRILNQSKVHN